MIKFTLFVLLMYNVGHLVLCICTYIQYKRSEVSTVNTPQSGMHQRVREFRNYARRRVHRLLSEFQGWAAIRSFDHIFFIESDEPDPLFTFLIER